MHKLCIISFTEKGSALACELKSYFDKNNTYGFSAEFPPKGVNRKEFISDKFSRYAGFIFIGATGIAVRYIAPLLKSKDIDPAVLVVDELGRYVIPLVSGHLGGANRLSKIVSYGIGAIPVITTATDINEKFAVDIWTRKSGCIISDISKIRYISSAVLRGEKVGFVSDFPIEGRLPDELTLIDFDKRYTEFEEDVECSPCTETKFRDRYIIPGVGIAVSMDESCSPFEITLNVIPRVICLGVGCRKDIDIRSFEDFVLSRLESHRIPIKSIYKIGSIDLKAEEKCILAFSEKYDIPFQTATKEELNSVPGNFNGSEFVKSVTGIDNVCERSAMWLAGGGSIIAPKESHEGITFALAMKDWKCVF